MEKQRSVLPQSISQNTGSFIDPKDNKKKYWFTKPVDEVLVEQLNRYANCFENDIDDRDKPKRLALKEVNNCMVLMSGDHGQGSSKFTAKFILRSIPASEAVSEPEPFVFVEQVCQIDCKKDTSQVLEMNIASDLRSALKRISESKKLYLFQGNAESNLYVSLINEKRDTADQLLKEIPIWLGMTGDLLFYSLVLGKENISGVWCWRCMMSRKEWNVLEGTRGRNWTIRNITNHYNSIQQLSGEKTPYQVCGVTGTPMFPSIEVENYVYLCFTLYS